MSFILDALKKSDSERQRQAGPALFEVRSATPRNGLPVWALALGALLAVNIVGLGWFLLRAPAAPMVAKPASTAPTQAPAPAATQATAPTRSAPIDAAPAGPAPIATARIATARIDTAPASAPPVLPPPAAVSPTAAAAEEPANPADYEEALPAREPLQPAHAEGSVEIAAGIAPTVDQLSPAIRSQLPPLHLDMHVYAARAADRFVFVNMHRLREGETTRDGIRVEEIVPTGVILSFRGTRFRLERD
ncbi:MAG: general secretion pathway protein GspB [Steroidobacteraceae bacterium]